MSIMSGVLRKGREKLRGSWGVWRVTVSGLVRFVCISLCNPVPSLKAQSINSSKKQKESGEGKKEGRDGARKRGRKGWVLRSSTTLREEREKRKQNWVTSENKPCWTSQLGLYPSSVLCTSLEIIKSLLRLLQKVRSSRFPNHSRASSVGSVFQPHKRVHLHRLSRLPGLCPHRAWQGQSPHPPLSPPQCHYWVGVNSTCLLDPSRLGPNSP